MRQARIADVSRYYGSNGLLWDVIESDLDCIIFCAGVGVTMDYTLAENVAQAKARQFPYATYHIPSPFAKLGKSVEEQARTYLAWPGVADALCIGDLEPPSHNDPRMVSGAEAVRYMQTLADNSAGVAPWWYSNEDSVGKMAWPHGLTQWDLLAAWYPYAPPTYTGQYLSFEAFLRDYAEDKTPWVVGTIYAPRLVGWQFTAHGQTPRIGVRKLDNDYSVSTIDAVEFMRKFWAGSVTPPEPQPDLQAFVVITNNLNVRVSPSTSAQVVRQLPAGARVEASEVYAPATGGACWAHLEDGWAAIVHNGSQHMRTE